MHSHGRENCSPLDTSQSKLDENVLQKILKISKVKKETYLERSPKFFDTKLMDTKLIIMTDGQLNLPAHAYKESYT